jgi:hypothetical protein
MPQPLDFSPLDMRARIYQDRALKAQASEQLVKSVAEGVFDTVRWQRDMRQKFAEASEFDSDITLDAQANSWFASQYQERLKTPEIEAIMNKRFKNQSHINEMNAIKAQMLRTGSTLKGLVDLRGKADVKVNENPLLYELDQDSISKFEDLITGKVSVNNPNAYMLNLTRGADGEDAFLKLRVNDIDPYINTHALKLVDEYKETKQTVTESVVGDRLNITTREQRFINDVVAKEFGSLVFASMMGDNGVKLILPTLAKDSTNKLALSNLASTGGIDDLTTYVTQVFDYGSILEPKEVITKEQSELFKKDKDGEEGKGSFIPKNEQGGYNLGSTPIRLITETKSGVTGGDVYEIYSKDGQYFAKMKVPSLSGEEMIELMNLTEDKLGRKPTKEEFMSAMIDKRYKTIDKVIDKNLYNEIDIALQRYPKGGLNLEEWDKVKETFANIKPDKSKSDEEKPKEDVKESKSFWGKVVGLFSKEEEKPVEEEVKFKRPNKKF